MGLAASLKCRDAGLIFSLAQWVKDLVLPQLWRGHNYSSDLIPGLGIPYARECPKKENKMIKRENKMIKRERERERSTTHRLNLIWFICRILLNFTHFFLCLINT